MKKSSIALVLLILSACDQTKQRIGEFPVSNEVGLPPAWTQTPEQSIRTPKPPTPAPSPDTKSLPIEGCHPRFISNDVVQRTIPSISPDGLTFVYLCGSSDDLQMCLMSTDGSNRRVISDEIGNLVDPKWSPSENTIAFVETISSDSGPTFSDIYLVSPEGEISTQVTDNPTTLYHSIDEIQWSPGGEWIAFSAGGLIGSEADDIYVIKSDGSDLFRLSFPPSLNYSPRWSPDGNRLAYISRSVEGFSYLVVTTLSGNVTQENRIPLPIGGGLSWSPDGQSIVYSDQRMDLKGDYDIHLYNFDNGKDYQLTTGEVIEFQPEWSKDGSVILFTSNQDGNFDLYTMNRDGSGVVKQVENLSDAFIHNPFWSSDGRTIYFFLADGKRDQYELWAADLLEFCE